MRQVAARAGVDASLVMQYFGSKRELFLAAIDLGTEVPDGDLGEHFDRVLRARLEEPTPQTRALVRSMLTDPDATAIMKAFLDDRVRNLVRASDGAGDDEDGEQVGAALAVSLILGLLVGRHFLRLDALVDLAPEHVESVIQPWLVAALGGVGGDGSGDDVGGDATGNSAG